MVYFENNYLRKKSAQLSTKIEIESDLKVGIGG
jgi:hypothetical protein